MDTKSFGAFVSSTRKERGLTQAELANKLQITVKAVSRWERGIGFPDIGMLEPLSDALGVSVVELLQAKRLEEQVVSVDEVSNAFVETINVAKVQQQQWMQRIIAICTIVILLALIPAIRMLTGMSLLRVFSIIAILIVLVLVVYAVLAHRTKTQQMNNSDK